VGDWWRPDPKRVRLFGAATYLDVAYADSTSDPYPPHLLEGFYSLGLLDYMLRCLFRVNEQSASALNYGLDRVRFPHTVTWDDYIRLESSFPAIEERTSGLLLHYDGVVHIRGNTRPAMVVNGCILFVPRDEAWGSGADAL
jgi:acyl dehydratase